MVKILILGGGFGGVRTAIDLEKKLRSDIIAGQIEITLADRNSYHLFVPAIYEVASAYGIPEDSFSVRLRKTVCIPYADIFEDKKIKFLECEIESIDTAGKKVKSKGGYVLDYDYLVFALGSEVFDYGIPGVTDYAYQFKNINDAVFINKKLESLSREFLDKKRTEPFSFLVCGAGFTGVELAAELGCCSKVIKSRCKLKGRCSTITLFEAGPKILPVVSEKERKAIKDRLTGLGIIIMENSAIEEVGSDHVKLKSGQKFQGDMVIWTAGIRANRFLSSVPGLPLTPTGKIFTDPNLRIKDSDHMFSLGDCAEIMDPKTGRPVPALGYVAAVQGKTVAKNIFNSIKNKKLSAYKPYYDLYILPVGGKYAVAHLWGGLMVKGFISWVLRVATDVKYFLSILPPIKAFRLYIDEMTVFLKND